MNNKDNGSDIAVIGLAGRFPGADDVSRFWDNIKQGVDSVKFFTDEELLAAGVSPELIASPNFVKAFPELDDIDKFDARFFNYTAAEAKFMDPQHRLFLETAWQAMENAGYNPYTYEGLTGVFGGISIHYYLWDIYFNHYKNALEAMSMFRLSLGSTMTTRVSYKMDLKGPALTMQAACCTSLVTIHYACQSLLNFESDMALAGGVSIQPFQKGYFTQEGALAADGHCKAFDAKADGMIGGSGVGIVVLKRLEDALEEGDYIYGVIKGSSMNNDGSQKIGYSAPGLQGQEKAVLEALEISGINPDEIGYVETHGTGTRLGDPIEVQALTNAYQKITGKKQYCAMGSVKTNVGHLDYAAGVAGFIKALYSVKDGVLPPSLHFKTPNPKIDFKNSPFYVNTELKQWEKTDRLRCAGVNSLGIGGTNVHLILQQAAPMKSDQSARANKLFLLSAKTETALEQQKKNLIDYFRQNPDSNPADVAYTLQVGRVPFNHRLSFAAAGRDDILEILEDNRKNSLFTGYNECEKRKVAFMFSGAGARYREMGRKLYREEPVFSETIDRCSILFEKHLGRNLAQEVFQEGVSADEVEQLNNQPATAFPILFMYEYALACLIMSLGITPDTMIGHSFGEYLAATIAGVFKLEDAVKITVKRGELFERVKEGGMITVPLAEEKIKPYLNDNISIAAINGASRCLLSGPADDITQLEKTLSTERIRFMKLPNSRAGHCKMVDEILEPFFEELRTLEFGTPQIPFVSSITGRLISDDEAQDPQYWKRHMRETVRFAGGIESLLEIDEDMLFLEIGPGQPLGMLARKIVGFDRFSHVISSVANPTEESSETLEYLNGLGKLWTQGVVIDYERYYGEERRLRLPLPTYPFERESYWVKTDTRFTVYDNQDILKNIMPAGKEQNTPSATKESPVIESGYFTPTWKRSALPMVKDQSVVNEMIDKNVLLFAGESRTAAELSLLLRPLFPSLIILNQGDAYDESRAHEHIYTINCDSKEDFYRLYHQLKKSDLLPDLLLDMTPVGLSEGAKGLTDPTWYYAFIQKSGDVRRMEVWNITGNQLDITGCEDLTSPDCAGPLNALETPAVFHLDLDRNNSAVKSAGQVIREMIYRVTNRFGTDKYRPTAYRGSYRWQKSLEGLNEMNNIPADRERTGSTYFIEKGLSGQGLHLSRYLAAKGDISLGIADVFPPAPDETGGPDVLTFDLAGQSATLDQWKKEIDRAYPVKGMDSYPGLLEAFDELTCSYICEFIAKKVDWTKGFSIESAELEKRLDIMDEFNHYYGIFTETLTDYGVIELKDTTITFLKDLSDLRPSSQLYKDFSGQYPLYASYFWFLNHCAAHFEDVFTGRIPANSVIFPEGNLTVLSDIYDNVLETTKNSLAFIKLTGKVVAEIEKRSNHKVRVLEVGAGMGLLTNEILSDIRDGDLEYHFTDIGKTFILKAQNRYDYDFMRYGLLDITRDPVEQEYRKYSYDIIIAYQAIHTTTDTHKTIDYMKSLLRPGGVLIIIEALKEYPYFSLISGLLPGWWNFSLDPARKDTPFLSLSAWKELLKDHEFEGIKTFPEEAAPLDDISIIFARKSEKFDADDYRQCEEEQKERRENEHTELHNRVAELKALGADVTLYDSAQGIKANLESFTPNDQGIDEIFLFSDDTYGSKKEFYHEQERLLSDTAAFCRDYTGHIGGLRLFSSLHSADEQPESNTFPGDRINRLFSYFGRDNEELFSQSVLWNKAALDHLSPSDMEYVFRSIFALESDNELVIKKIDPALLSRGEDQGERSENSEETTPESDADSKERVLVEICRVILGVDKVDPDESLFNYGIDSLLALQLISRIRFIYNLTIPIKDLYTRPTVRAILDYINTHAQEAEEKPEEKREIEVTKRGEQNLEDMLSEIDNLSDDELEDLL